MPIVMATSTFGLGKRRQTAPQQCCLRTILAEPITTIITVFGNENTRTKITELLFSVQVSEDTTQ